MVINLSFAGNASTSDTRIKITFTTSNSSVVFAWGGHMACANDWCPGNSSAGINGSAYHMNLISVDGSGGSQAKSLSTAAIYRN